MRQFKLSLSTSLIHMLGDNHSWEFQSLEQLKKIKFMERGLMHSKLH